MNILTHVPSRPHRASRAPREPVWGAVVIRLATAGDRPALVRLAELDSQQPPSGPALIGEVAGRAVAAVSLADGRVIADPFVLTGNVVDLLRMRAAQLRRTLRGGERAA